MGDVKSDRGRAIIREMFGTKAVQSLDCPSEFMQPLQDVVTRFCFGEIWDRPGLSRRDRSMITIAILVGQSRPQQLQRHIKGAIENGLSKQEISEILMHAMVYCGVPAGADAFSQGMTALQEMGLE